MVTVVIMTFVQYIQISDQYTVPLKLYNVTCQLFPPPKKKNPDITIWLLATK